MLDILLVDDEPDFRVLVGDALRDAGHRVSLAANGAEGLTQISSNVFDVMICDIRLPKVDGLTLFRRVRQESPGTDVILITAHAAINDAVSALKEGAYDYLTKPFDLDEIVLQLQRIATQRALKRELEQARAELSQRKSNGAGPGPGAIIGRSPPMLRLSDRIETIAQSDAPVLITGESGTGKELVARTLHDRSSRRNKPFIAVNCAAFPETLLEAELFGHERGAFTGAVKRRDGRFKAADGGTLLLDEIAEVPLPAQAKLLRVLQEGTVEPLGTNESTRVDVRIISATHRNLRERIKEGRFREDLYYRLNVLDIEIPPLRERRGDLPLLLQYFLNKFTQPGKPPSTISPRAWAVLSQYHFPGNVREFAHAIEHAVVLAGGGEIEVEHLPGGITGALDGARQHAGRLAPLAERRAQGVRARVPDAGARPVQRQEDEGRRDPGDLAQEPLGEAPPARDRLRGRSRRVVGRAVGRPGSSEVPREHRADARHPLVELGGQQRRGRPQAAGQRRQIARRDDRLRPVEQEPQPQRRSPEHGVVVAQRGGPPERHQSFEHSRRRRGADLRIGGVAQLAERDQQLDVHDSARIELEVTRALRHLPALALHPPPHAAEIGPKAVVVDRQIERQ